ncbi:MAG: tetratricopeptide repeat protein [Pseudomonadota bacterium]
MDVISANASALFSTRASQQAQLENLAQRQLSSALEFFTAQKYDEAIVTFKRAISLAPLSSTATSAYDYMARAYLSKEDVGSAIAAYRESLRGNPTDANAYAQLGNIYVTQGDMEQAKTAYQQAVRLDPSSPNRYSLGQAYLELGDYASAISEFQAVKELEAGKPNGDYGLGLVYARQGKTEEAVRAFERAISLQADFWFAHVELGYALTELGERDKAAELVQEMRGQADDLADTLDAYIYEKTPAEMAAVLATSTFARFSGPKTLVANLDSYLATPGGQQTFSMVFMFNKDMDAQSVENVRNWSIARAYDLGRGTIYNYGMTVPDTEIALDRYPVSVTYNEEDRTATVLFRVTQNAAGDGTLDPSHIKFSFSGSDTFGQKIGDQADEYLGVRGFA